MVEPLAVTLVATLLLCVLSWPFARRTRAGGLVAILFALSFAGFLVCAWFAAPGAFDAF